MSFTPTSAQTLFMLRLVFGPREPKLDDTRPQLKPAAARNQLASLGLIRFEKRGRSRHVLLTEQGWAWVQSHLDAPIHASGSTPGHVLGELLPRLKAFFAAHGFALGELFTTEAALTTAVALSAAAPSESSARGNPEEQLLAALRELDQGRRGRLLLAAARAALPQMSTAAFDSAALSLQARGLIALYHLDDPAQRNALVEQSAIHVAGSRYHIAYLSG